MLVAQHDQSPPLSRGLATTATIAYIQGIPDHVQWTSYFKGRLFVQWTISVKVFYLIEKPNYYQS